MPHEDPIRDDELSGVASGGTASPITRRSLLRTVGAVSTATAATAVAPATGRTERATEQSLPRLAVADGAIVADGEPVTLRGLNVVDPKRANVTAPARGRDAAQQLALLTDRERGWHPDVIRIPVQPVDIGEHPPGEGPAPPAFDQAQLDAYLETHLDPIVEQCGAAGVYAIVDFHRHRTAWGDADAGTVNDALRTETISFWQTVAPRYGDMDHVAFEAYNEPTTPGMWAGIENEQVRAVWQLYLEFVQPVVDAIRAATDALVLVGSPGWSQSPEGALIEPVAGSNLAYTYHVYPGHASSQQENWEDASIEGMGVEGVYEEVPLVVTEFGWTDADHEIYGGTTATFGRPFLEWLESYPQIHWTAWCGDVWWAPPMFAQGFAASEWSWNPYDGEVPADCPDRPCEWRLLGRDAGGRADMGEYVRQALEVGGVPAGYLDGGGADPSATDGSDESDSETDGGDGSGATDGTPDSAGTAANDSATPAGESDGLPGFGLLAGAAGVLGGLGALRHRASDEDAPTDRS